MSENNTPGQQPHQPSPTPPDNDSFWSRHAKLFIRLIIIAIIIIGAAIYSNGRNPKVDDAKLATGDVMTDDGEAAATTAPDEEQPVINVKDDTDDGTKVVVAQEEQPEDTVAVSGNVVTTVVQPGEGYTHQARKALAEYLKSKSSVSLNAEQKIFAEDYLQKNLSEKHRLYSGDEVSFSQESVEASIDAALGLTSSQIQNLSKYVSSVPL